MKLFIPMLALVWLAAIAMVSMGHRGQGEGRGRGQSTYAMKTYVRQLQGCLRDVRQQNKILEDKNRILEVEIETYKTKNEKLQEEIDELEEISQCCKTNIFII